MGRLLGTDLVLLCTAAHCTSGWHFRGEERQWCSDSRLRHLFSMKQGGQVIMGASVTSGYNEVAASKLDNILMF